VISHFELTRRSRHAGVSPLPAIAIVAIALAACDVEPRDDEGPVNAADLRSLGNMRLAVNSTRTEMRRYNEHVRLSRLRTVTHSDSARVRLVADSIRRAISRYQDVSAARLAGYEQYAPGAEVDEYHFLRYDTPITREKFDVADPPALIYKKDSSGRLVLAGAMYVLSGETDDSALDSAIPLGIARWHKHVNWCLPPVDQQHRWMERKGGDRVFGLVGVTSRRACQKANGVFKPDLAGWMIHALVFEGPDLKAVWGGEQMGMVHSH